MKDLEEHSANDAEAKVGDLAEWQAMTHSYALAYAQCGLVSVAAELFDHFFEHGPQDDLRLLEFACQLHIKLRRFAAAQSYITQLMKFAPNNGVVKDLDIKLKSKAAQARGNYDFNLLAKLNADDSGHGDYIDMATFVGDIEMANSSIHGSGMIATKN